LIEKEKCTLQNVVTVVTNVKYHLSQKKTDLFIAENASKTTDLLQDKVAVDLVEETIDHVKCTLQNVVTVVTNVKYHLSQKKTDLFIAENASKTTKIRTIVLSNFQNYFIL
jgi:hypothetical protein